MKFTIDRFEEELAIIELEDKKIIEVPRAILPLDAKEGDIINISVDKTETVERKKRLQEKFDRLLCEE